MSLEVNRLCQAYNRCALMNCIGTPINLKRPLCGLGGLVRTYGAMSLQSFKGGWVILVELLGLVVKLSTKKVGGVDISFPEDAFMSQMCVAKDAGAHLFSIATSMLNSAMQLGQADVGYIYHGAVNVDTNADAALTVTMLAVTSFLQQMNMFSIYSMIATHQIMMCEVNGMLAVIDATGFKVRVQSAALSDASSVIGGQCLTVGDEMMARYPSENQAALGYKLSTTLQNLFNLILIQQIQPSLSYLDALLTYWSGIVTSMGAILMTQYMALCNPPENYLHDIATCACNDTVLVIPEARATQGYSTYDGLWCTGTLGMIDGSNGPFVVYNPYTYRQLQVMAHAMEAYLACASVSYVCTPPVDTGGEFAFQGVTLLNVLVKCRENFAKRTWDPMAYVLFDSTQQRRFKTRSRIQLPRDDVGVASCLLAQASIGAENSACLDLYLFDKNINLEKYWSYERGLPASPVQFIDACLTFSGPAKQNISVFQNCVDDEQFTGCTLSSHIWSPSSPNSVPVAQPHVVMYQGRQADSLIYRLYDEALGLVKTAVDAANLRWMVHPDNVDAQFFSAEGDIIHQMLDCVFMGPYARVDYWPIPTCEGDEECLVGPYWSRDEGDGASRGVDPYTCPAPPSLPFTCGSPARRSLVKYYVNHFLTRKNSNTSVFQQAVRLQIQDVWDAWKDTGAYGCLCADASHSFVCCADAGGAYLPDSLRFDPSDLKSDNVMQALLDGDFDTIYLHALERQEVWMQFMDAAEADRYSWNTSRRAADEGRFNPKEPVYEYSPKEAMSPLQSVDSTLWDVCHASFKQVFWTLPIDPDANTIVFGASRGADGTITPDPLSFDALPYDGDQSHLEEYISALVYQAALDSPLYRHHIVKHAPSESLMCAANLDTILEPLSASGVLDFSDYVQATSDMPVRLVHGEELGTLPVFGYRNLSLGAAQCPCGWRFVKGMCEAPKQHPGVCTAVFDAIGRSDCLFWPENETLILSMADNTWPCPEFDMSAHWGLLDAASMEQWLTGVNTLTTSAEDLLRYGRAGVRIGNLDDLRSITGLYKNRRESRDRARNFACNLPNAPPDDLAEALVDQLFPMAQGVEDVGVNANCLRYTLEVARSAALNLTIPDSPEASRQVHVVDRWRRRCGAQLQLLALCVNLDVFRAPDPLTNFKSQCGHFARINLPTAYTTPECLVFIHDIIYDPCRCLPCVGLSNASLDLAFLQRTPACRVRFDPRDYLNPSPVGWWPVGHKYRDAVKDPVDLLSDVFAWDALDDLVDPFEGPMNQTEEMCDMVADWWPDEWDFPVGYHVTVPCEDAAYRTFHQAFGLDIDGSGQTILRYQHDLLRPAELVDTHYLGSLCRSNVWGIETYNLNTMRYCTRASNDTREDYTVYGLDHTVSPGWTAWACADTSAHLPWPRGTFDSEYTSSLHSVGTVPNMPAQGSDYYPSDLSTVYSPGPRQDILFDQYGWGQSCSDYALFICVIDYDCPLNYQCRGRFCRGTDTSCQSSSPTCVCQGVCIEQSTQCVKHSECPSGLMCTGLGECVTPTLTVQNTVDDDMAFQLFSQQCPAGSRNFSLLGASHWGYLTADVLRVHGMCSYGDWYKYQQTLAKCSKVDAGDHYELDPSTCSYIDLDATTVNVTNWWDRGGARPNILFMHPSNCDRDYERLEKFQSCAPVPGTPGLSLAVGMIPLGMTFDQYIKAHKGVSPSQGGVTIPLAKMPNLIDPKYGFLGVGSFAKDADIANIFHPCTNIDQCSASPFTSNGKKVTRVRWDGKNYTDNDVFKCGALGYVDGSQCRVDLTVFPFYNYFCKQQHVCPTVLPFIGVLCNAVLDTYPFGYAGVSANVDALNALLGAFSVPVTVDQYLNTIDCITPLYSFVKSSLYHSLYYALDFVLVEFPFDWFFQCMVMANKPINPASRVSQDCPAFQNRLAYTIGAYNPPNPSGVTAMQFLQQVRGGYTTSYITSFVEQHRAIANDTVSRVIDNIVKQQYGSVDTTYPQCSSNKKWKLGVEYHADFRALIDTFYSSRTCSSSWLEDQIDVLAKAGWNIGIDNWTDFLTMRDDDSLAVQPGWGNQPTLLELIRQFLVGHVYSKPVDFVMGYNLGASDGLNYAQREAIMLVNTPPSTFTDDVPYDLDPLTMDQGDPGTQVFDGPPYACAYDDHYHDDPALRDMPGNANCRSVDMGGYSLYQCVSSSGQQPSICTKVPVNYAINGQFYCGYIPYSTSITCDYSSASGCGQQLLQALYTQVIGLYTPLTVVPLPPIPFPWFDDANSSSFTFSLASALDYLGNIMPDKEKSVMCTINTLSLVDLMNCTNEHYRRLQRHVTEQFTYNSSVIVPRYAQLTWPVDRGFLMKGGIFSYASVTRDTSKTFLDALFNDASVCTGDVSTHMCWRGSSNSTWNSVNPWLLGYWNPFLECDIDYLDQTQSGAEYINAQCTQQVCPNPGPYSDNMPFSAACSAMYRTKVSVPGVPAVDINGPVAYNLCHHTLLEDQAGCLHDQGLLGGFDGLPVGAGTASRPMTYDTPYSSYGYTVSDNMYQPSKWDIPPDYADGSIFDNRNPLWAGAPGLYGFLRVNEQDIGVHRLSLRLTRSSNATDEAFSTLSVYKLPLLSSADDSSSLPVNQWVPGLPVSLESNLLGQSSTISAGDASCPLRRIAFYSPDLASFSPIAPSPLRASHIFRNITAGLGAHPVLSPISNGKYLGKYVTSNGFCFCPVVQGIPQSQCQIKIGDSNDQCSFLQTIAALRGQPQSSFVFTPYDALHRPIPCTMHLDWPNIPNPMRDGSTAPGDFTGASDPASRTCHVLDRLYPFQYKYQSILATLASNILSTGPTSYLQGTCQTRRASTLPVDPPSHRCVRGALSYDQAAILCEPGQPRVSPLSRKTPLTPRQTYVKMRTVRRNRCNRCARPPRFTTQQGETIAPESSFGMHYKLSAERALAKDLRDAVCGSDPVCPLLNRSAWKRGAFLHNYAHAPWLLFLNASKPLPASTKAILDDSDAWTSKPWVYCPDRSSLKSGENCQGTISRAEWLSGKATLCPHMIKALSTGGNGSNQDPLARTDFCSVDSTTQQLCVAVASAQRLVSLANCIAAGNISCLPTPWAYHPASFDATNQQWVYKTVLDYYRLVGPVQTCPMTSTELSQAAYNTQFMKKCPANSMRFFVDIIAVIRIIATDVALIVTMLFSMSFKLLTLLFTGIDQGLQSTLTTVRAELTADYAWLKNHIKSMADTLFDMLSDMLFSSGQIGTGLLGFLDKTCNAVNTAYNWFLHVWCKYIERYMASFFSTFRKALSMIASGFEILQDFMDEILQGVLPAAFMAKYGNRLFQTRMVEKYSQPTARSKSTLNRVQSTSKLASKSLTSIGKKAFVGLGTLGTLLSVGFAAYEAYQDIQGALVYPDNFTLFDFSEVFPLFLTGV